MKPPILGSNKIKWLENPCCDILLIDFSNLEEENLIEVIHEVKWYFMSLPKDYEGDNIIIDFTNSQINETSRRILKDVIESLKKYFHINCGLTNRTYPAITVGLRGFPKVMAGFIIKYTYEMDNIDDAIHFIESNHKNLRHG